MKCFIGDWLVSIFPLRITISTIDFKNENISIVPSLPLSPLLPDPRLNGQPSMHGSLLNQSRGHNKDNNEIPTRSTNLTILRLHHLHQRSQ